MCQKKTVKVCGTCLLSEKEWIDSKITKLQTIGIADTTVAFVNGQVLGVSNRNDSIYIDTLRLRQLALKICKTLSEQM